MLAGAERHDAGAGEAPPELRRLLGDRELRSRFGAAARERAARLLSWPSVTDATLRAYAEAIG